MKSLGEFLKKYWYLLVITGVLLLPGFYGSVMLIWIIGWMLNNVWLSIFISAAVGVLITTLPMAILSIKAIDQLDRQSAVKIYLGSIGVVSIIYLIFYSMVLVRSY